MTAWVSPSEASPSSGEPVEAGGLRLLPELGKVFCDWLDVTFSPSESLDWLPALLASAGATDHGGSYLFPSGGVIKHQVNSRWQRISVSGKALAVLRDYGLFDDLLRSISQHPYKVTRIDAALDLGIDAAPIVRGLWERYQSEPLRLNLWNAVLPRRFENYRFDGVVTGTFYAGSRKVNKISARVYDKQNEVYEHHRYDCGSRLRYELTVKTDQVTLRDASDPTALFWHYASPALLDRPSGIPDWVAGNPYVWQCASNAVLSDEDRLYKAVYYAGDLNAAIAICGQSVGLFEYLLKLVRLRVLQRASSLPGWGVSYE